MGGVASLPEQAPDICLPAVFSLDRALRFSSNPALTAWRYRHSRGLHSDLLRDFTQLPGAELLGRGSTVEVVRIASRADGRHYALKTFNKKEVCAEALGLMNTEVEIYLGIDHPHIARLEGVYDSEEELHLVMECCEGGELYQRVVDRGSFSQLEAASVARQMLRALGYLHSHGIAHRDLKLENILHEGPEPDSPLKLVDFGLAWAAGSEDMHRCCGSLDYVAPEILLRRGYTSKCDLWSLGVIIFMLLTGRAPMPGGADQCARILAGTINWDRWRLDGADEALDFVRRLLAPDPAERLDAQQAIFHPWLLRTLGNHVSLPALDVQALRALKAYANAPRARRIGLQLVAQYLAPEQTRALQEAFLALDLNNDGVLRVEDLRRTLRGQCAPSSAVVDELCRLLEAIEPFSGESEGGVRYSEFLAAASQGLCLEPAVAVFRRLDRHSRGAIDAGDLESALGPVFAEEDPLAGRGRWAELIREADPTGEFVFTGSLGLDAFLAILDDAPGARARGAAAKRRHMTAAEGCFSAARCALRGPALTAASA